MTPHTVFHKNKYSEVVIFQIQSYQSWYSIIKKRKEKKPNIRAVMAVTAFKAGKNEL